MSDARDQYRARQLGEHSRSDHPTRAEVVVTGIEMDFWDIVAHLIKWEFALLMALLLMTAVLLVVAVIVGALFGWPLF